MSAFPSATLISEFFNLITGDTPHLALYTTNPGPTNTGTEVSGGLYGRQVITFGSIVSGTISNNATIEFSGVPSAVITHWAILNASTGGDLLAYGAINSSAISETGDNVTFASGDIDLTFAGS